METLTFISAVGEGFSQIGNALELFVKPPTVYFTALAFASGALGVARKLIPMKKK